MIDEIATDVYDLTIAELNGGRYRVFLFDGETPILVDALKTSCILDKNCRLESETRQGAAVVPIAGLVVATSVVHLIAIAAVGFLD